MAKGWYDEMPEKAVDIVLGKKLQAGVKLVRVTSDVCRPNFKDMRF